MAPLCYTYAGVVESNLDPLRLGRLKVRVPHVYGSATSGAGYIGTNDLPWALPAGLPAGGSNASGGFSMLPVTNDKVWVRFLDGEPEKPIWEWAMQTIDFAGTLKLNRYADGTPVGPPDRTILTRYGHSIEIMQDHVAVTTAEGQQVLLQTSQSPTGGSAALQTPAGQRVTLNDPSQNVVIQGQETAVLSAATVILNAPTSTLIKTERLTILAGTSTVSIQNGAISITTASGASVVVSDTGSIALTSAGSGACVAVEKAGIQIGEKTGTGIVIKSGKMSVNAPQLALNSVAIAIDGINLSMPAFLWWLFNHTHTIPEGSSVTLKPTEPPPII